MARILLVALIFGLMTVTAASHAVASPIDSQKELSFDR